MKAENKIILSALIFAALIWMLDILFQKIPLDNNLSNKNLFRTLMFLSILLFGYISSKIYERKTAKEEKINTEKLKFEKLIDITGVMIIAINHDETVEIANLKACELFECTKEEIIGKNWFDNFIPAIHRNDIRKIFNQIISGKVSGAENVEGPVITAKKKIRIINWRNTYLTDDKGKIILTLSAGEDITEKKLNEDKLVYSDLLLHSIPDAIIAVDNIGNINKWLGKAEQIFGYSENEILKKNAEILFPEEVKKQMMSEIKGTLKKHNIYLNEIECRTKSGKKKIINVSVKNLYDSAGNSLGAISINRDITEMYKVQEEIKKLASILENTEDAVINTSLDGIIQYWNKGAEHIFGFTKDEVINKNLSIVFPEENMSELYSNIEKIKNGEIIKRLETVRQNKSGKKITVSINITPIKNKDNRIIGISKIARDVSERKKSEKALKESEEKLRTLINVLNDSVFFIDENGTITELNESAAKLFKTEQCSLKGKNIFSIYPDDVIDHRKAGIEEVIRTGKSIKFEDKLFSKWYDNKIYPIYDISGELKNIAIFSNDITHLKRIENALRESREQFKLFMDYLPAAVFIYDEHSNFIYGNAYMQKYFNSQKFMGKKPHEYFPKPTAQKMLYENKRVLEENYLETTVKLKDVFGEHHIYKTHKFIVKLPGKAPLIGGIGLDITKQKEAEDNLKNAHNELEKRVEKRTKELVLTNIKLEQEITERKQAQLEMKNAKDEAEKANKAKSEFLANMSHELRTPLNAILGYAQILKKDSTNNDITARGLETIQNSGKHLLEMINDILDLSKIEAGKMELHKNAFNFIEFLNNISEIVKVKANKKEIEFYARFSENIPKGVYTDETRLRQVLINLLDNAVKYTKQGQVIFKVFKESEKILFHIIDTGIGIEEGQLKEIFLPFQQASSLLNKEEGTGLGLAISKRILEVLGSKLDVSSEVGKGSKFSFSLNLEEIEDFTTISDLKTDKIIGYQGKKLTVLIADDNEINRDILKQMLTPLGFNILEADDGQKCYDLTMTKKPSIVLLDLKMPILNGFETCKKIRNTESVTSIPVIAFSASVFSSTKNKSIGAGCNDFLTKPIKEDELLSVISKNLNIEWVYEGQEEEEHFDIDDSDIDFGLLLSQIPDLVKHELILLAQRGSAIRMVNEFEEIENSDSKFLPLVLKLKKFVKKYDFKGIVEFLSGNERK